MARPLLAARTKQTARSSTGGVSAARRARRTGAISKKKGMMQMPYFFKRIMNDIKDTCQTYNAKSTWEIHPPRQR